jgi:hypothetical protein
MSLKKIFLTVVLLILVLSVTSACKNNMNEPTTSILSGSALMNSDSIVTAKIYSVRKQSLGFPWELDVLIQNSIDVKSLRNPTKSSVGKLTNVFTDQDMTGYKEDDVVTARVKYAGDVNIPGGIILYMYNVVLDAKP